MGSFFTTAFLGLMLSCPGTSRLLHQPDGLVNTSVIVGANQANAPEQSTGVGALGVVGQKWANFNYKQDELPTPSPEGWHLQVFTGLTYPGVNERGGGIGPHMSLFDEDGNDLWLRETSFPDPWISADKPGNYFCHLNHKDLVLDGNIRPPLETPRVRDPNLAQWTEAAHKPAAYAVLDYSADAVCISHLTAAMPGPTTVVVRLADWAIRCGKHVQYGYSSRWKSKSLEQNDPPKCVWMGSPEAHSLVTSIQVHLDSFGSVDKPEDVKLDDMCQPWKVRVSYETKPEVRVVVQDRNNTGLSREKVAKIGYNRPDPEEDRGNPARYQYANPYASLHSEYREEEKAKQDSEAYEWGMAGRKDTGVPEHLQDLHFTTAAPKEIETNVLAWNATENNSTENSTEKRQARALRKRIPGGLQFRSWVVHTEDSEHSAFEACSSANYAGPDVANWSERLFCRVSDGKLFVFCEDGMERDGGECFDAEANLMADNGLAKRDTQYEHVSDFRRDPGHIDKTCTLGYCFT